jgi:hypothetical protein
VDAEGKYRPVVELLLARMESSPEEFVEGNPKRTKWNRVIDMVDQWGTKAEKEAVRRARSDIYMATAHRAAMSVILDAPEPEQKKGGPITMAQMQEVTKKLLAESFQNEVERNAAKLLGSNL